MKITGIALLAHLASTADAGRLLGSYPTEAPTNAPTEDTCTCVTDYDCGPICVKPYNSATGTCQGGGPSPTAAPVSKGDCPCDKPRHIPTECEVKHLIELLDDAVSIDHGFAPQNLRASFHDAGTFNQNVPGEGGANGCLMNHPPMLLQGENAFLDPPITKLRSIKNFWEAHEDTCCDERCLRVSSADIIQFAGLFATQRQRDDSAPVGTIDPAKQAALLAYQWGRPDELNCVPAWTENLPGMNPPGLTIMDRCPAAGMEIEEKMMHRNGFTKTEANVLIGAHTIGRIRNTFGGPGPWALNGDDTATPEGGVFDNAFHKFLEFDVAATDVPSFDTNTAAFDETFPNWFRVSSGPLATVSHLDSDVTLKLSPLGPLPDFTSDTTSFANDNAGFLARFDKAFDKMTKLGVDKNILSLPKPCCDGKSSEQLAAGFVAEVQH
mmetsp:Transcript_41306/g.125002  ORF Transcript_41306/g.125002 Transcript_41306/m.125002 type:complete len:438 (-) Transcript_41306:315-1628(-)